MTSTSEKGVTFTATEVALVQALRRASVLSDDLYERDDRIQRLTTKIVDLEEETALVTKLDNECRTLRKQLDAAGRDLLDAQRAHVEHVADIKKKFVEALTNVQNLSNQTPETP